jgi:hypothetical protein
MQAVFYKKLNQSEIIPFPQIKALLHPTKTKVTSL